MKKIFMAGFMLFPAFSASVQSAPVSPLSSSPTVTLVMLGDSLTAGYGLQASAALPRVLERMLIEKGYNVTIQNAGVSGDTSAQGLARANWSVPDEAQGVIVALGANDMLRGQPPADTRANLKQIISDLKQRNKAVMLVGMRASANWGPDYSRAFDAIFPELARNYTLPLYPFMLDGVVGRTELNLQDGLHPNAKGIDIIAGRMLPTVETFIQSLTQSSRQ